MRYYIISTILHALCLFAISFSGGSGDGGSEKHGSKGGSRFGGVNIPGDVKSKEKVEITVIETVNGKGKKPPAVKKRKVLKNCGNKWYGGIGIQTGYSQEGDLVTRVFPGYPADLGGIVPGDIITAISGKQIPGPPGTQVTLKINRGNQIHILTLTRDKVCY